MDLNREQKLNFLIENVNELDKEDRVRILNIAVQAIGAEKMQFKGSGTQFKTQHLNNAQVDNLYGFVSNKLIIIQNQLDNISE